MRERRRNQELGPRDSVEAGVKQGYSETQPHIYRLQAKVSRKLGPKEDTAFDG